MSEAIQCKGCEAVSYNEFGLTSLYCGACYQAQAAALHEMEITVPHSTIIGLRKELADVTKERDDWITSSANLNALLVARNDELTSAQATIAEWGEKCTRLCHAHGNLLIQHHDAQATIQRLEGAAAKCGVPSLTAIEQIEWMAKELRRMRKVINDFCCLEETLTHRLATVEAALKDMTESKVRCWNEWTFAQQQVEALETALRDLLEDCCDMDQDRVAIVKARQALAPAPGGQEGTK